MACPAIGSAGQFVIGSPNANPGLGSASNDRQEARRAVVRGGLRPARKKPEAIRGHVRHAARSACCRSDRRSGGSSATGTGWRGNRREFASRWLVIRPRRKETTNLHYAEQ